MPKVKVTGADGPGLPMTACTANVLTITAACADTGAALNSSDER